jgi:hypothetical protein
LDECSIMSDAGDSVLTYITSNIAYGEADGDYSLDEGHCSVMFYFQCNDEITSLKSKTSDNNITDVLRFKLRLNIRHTLC